MLIIVDNSSTYRVNKTKDQIAVNADDYELFYQPTYEPNVKIRLNYCGHGLRTRQVSI